MSKVVTERMVKSEIECERAQEYRCGVAWTEQRVFRSHRMTAPRSRWIGFCIPTDALSFFSGRDQVTARVDGCPSTLQGIQMRREARSESRHVNPMPCTAAIEQTPTNRGVSQSHRSFRKLLDPVVRRSGLEGTLSVSFPTEESIAFVGCDASMLKRIFNSQNITKRS